MRALRHRLRTPRTLRIRAGVGVLVCLAATLLLGPLASAQEDPPAGGRPASDASVDEAVEEPASDADPSAPDAEGVEEPEGEAEADASDEDVTSAEAVEEFLVTAHKIEIVVPDTTISVIGFDPEEIRAEGIKDIRDLSNFTPSLDIKSAFAVSNPTIFIRGVGLDDYNANSANAVAIYQDGVYMASPAGQLFQFYDVDSIEVLRGPQPTLFRNAEAGAILVNSAKPTDELDGYLESTYGRYNEVELEGALSGPLVPGWLSGRLSGNWGIRDGITENRCATLGPNVFPCNQRFQGNVPVLEPGIDTFTNDVNAFAARGQLLFKPPLDESEMSWLWNAHGGKNFGRAFQYQHRGVRFKPPADVPGCTPDSQEPECLFVPFPLQPPQFDQSNYRDTDGDPFAGDYNIDGPEKLALWGTNLKGTWVLGDGYEVGSLTAYEWHDRFIQENTDANPRFLLESTYGDRAWQLSQELDLRGDWNLSDLDDGKWVIGAYYLQEDLRVENFFDIRDGTDLLQKYKQRTRNFAAFAWSEYKLQPGCATISCDFTLVGGLRYNVEYKKFDILACAIAGTTCNTSLQAVDDDLWSGLGGEASLAWDFTEESQIYLKYSRGWKGGHFNGGAITPFDIITAVEPETVDSYETGLRSYWFDQRLMLNLTGFYYDYQDLQVFIIEQTPVGFPIPKLVNAKNATVYGVELDLGISPLEGLTLTYNFAWVESRYNDFTVSLPFTIRPPREGNLPRPQFQIRKDFDYSGNPLIASPRYSMTGSAQYEIPLPEVREVALGSLTPRFSFSWKDDVFYDASGGKGALVNFPAGTFGQEAYWVFNAALTWRSANDRFEVIGWIRNFLDEEYKTQSFDLTRGNQLILDAYADPKTYGITATINFDGALFDF